MKIPAFRILSAAVLALALTACNKDSSAGPARSSSSPSSATTPPPSGPSPAPASKPPRRSSATWRSISASPPPAVPRNNNRSSTTCSPRAWTASPLVRSIPPTKPLSSTGSPSQTLLICHDSDAPESKRVCLHRHRQFRRRRRGRQADQGSPARTAARSWSSSAHRCGKRQAALRRHQEGTRRLESEGHRRPHRRHRHRARPEKRRGHTRQISRTSPPSSASTTTTAPPSSTPSAPPARPAR